MLRRTVLSMLAAFAAAPALAQGSNASKAATVPDAKLYDVLGTPIAADRKRVRLFFSYDCPFSRNFHNGLVSWGSSLPSGIAFQAYPVIPDADDPKVAVAVIGRLIAQELSPKSLPAYDYMMYSAIQGDSDANTPPAIRLSVEDVLAALVKAGVDKNELQQFLRTKGKGIEKRLPAHAQTIKTYSLAATPSVVIGGRFVINPDHTQGNPQHMLLVLNGLVSRVIQGGTHGI